MTCIIYNLVSVVIHLKPCNGKWAYLEGVLGYFRALLGARGPSQVCANHLLGQGEVGLCRGEFSCMNLKPAQLDFNRLKPR